MPISDILLNVAQSHFNTFHLNICVQFLETVLQPESQIVVEELDFTFSLMKQRCYVLFIAVLLT